MNIFKWAIDRIFYMDSHQKKYLKVYFIPPKDDPNDLNYYLEKLKNIRKSFVYCHKDYGCKLVAIFEINKNDVVKKEAEEICQEFFLATDMKIRITNWKEVLIE